LSNTLIYRSIPEQVLDNLRREILSGKLIPGEPLREQEISDRFGVSRGPVREALRQLTQQGLLVLEPNKGVRIAQYLSESVRPLTIELRRKIETFVLDSIFEQITWSITICVFIKPSFRATMIKTSLSSGSPLPCGC